MTSSIPRATTWAPALLAAALLAYAAPAGAATTASATESYSAFQSQINGGKVRHVLFNKKTHIAHVTLKDGKRLDVSYPSHDEPKIAAQLQSKGATFRVEQSKKKKAAVVHHKLRYIAAGVVGVLVVIVGVVLALNRRRPRLAEPGDGAAAPHAAGPPPGASPAGAPSAGEPAVSPGAEAARES